MSDQYKCQSYYDEDNVLHDCTCGKCENIMESGYTGAQES